MSGTAVVIIKIMPTSPSVDLEHIKKQIMHFAEHNGGKSVTIETQEVAFGLKALILKMAFPEEKGTDMIEEHISKIKDVSSVTIEDYRRAFG